MHSEVAEKVGDKYYAFSDYKIPGYDAMTFCHSKFMELADVSTAALMGNIMAYLGKRQIRLGAWE